MATYDVRDFRNALTREVVVKQTPFLVRYVDATATGVNLSAASAAIWSMSSVRGFVGHVQDRYRLLDGDRPNGR